MNDYVKKYGRVLDYLALLNNPRTSSKMCEELKTYQNIDGGFGHGLEIDIQADVAIQYIKNINPSKKLEEMIVGMIHYYETMFDYSNHQWHMVEKEIESYPHAIWCNYDARSSFGLLNPTPEILAFLYLHQGQVKTINLTDEIALMVSRIIELLPQSKSFHDVLSVLRFYRDIPYIQQDIVNVLREKTQEFIANQEGNYYLRAHQVALIVEGFVSKEQWLDDINMLKEQLQNDGFIECPWEWFQYPEEFEKVKPLWNAFLTRQAIEAIVQFEASE